MIISSTIGLSIQTLKTNLQLLTHPRRPARSKELVISESNRNGRNRKTRKTLKSKTAEDEDVDYRLYNPYHPCIVWLVVSDVFYFHPYLGKISILTNIFQMGWNHHLVVYLPLFTI